jgi:ABC-type hemin transport system substrate-binding protein
MAYPDDVIRVPRLALLLLAAAVLLAACGRAPAPQPAPVVQPPLARIVSLAPELTQMVMDLGKGDLLVGVCSDDPAAPKGLRTVGDYRHIDEESLVALRPTLVLTMFGQEGPNTRLDDLGQVHQFRVVGYPSPHRIREMEEIISDPEGLTVGNAGRGVGTVLGDYEGGWKLMLKVQMELGALEDLTLRLSSKPAVLLLIGTHPLLAVGPESVHSDLLLHYCGARNAAWNLVGNAPQISRERILEAQPDIIILIQPNGDPLKSVDDDDRLTELRGLEVPAVKDHKIFLLDDPRGMLESSSLPVIASKLAKIINPDLAEKIDSAMAAATAAATQPIKPRTPDRPAATQPATQPADAPAPAPAPANP